MSNLAELIAYLKRLNRNVKLLHIFTRHINNKLATQNFETKLDTLMKLTLLRLESCEVKGVYLKQISPKYETKDVGDVQCYSTDVHRDELYRQTLAKFTHC